MSRFFSGNSFVFLDEYLEKEIAIGLAKELGRDRNFL
jgi:hypothetical protein